MRQMLRCSGYERAMWQSAEDGLSEFELSRWLLIKFRLYLLHLLLKSSSLFGYRARALIDLLMSRGRV